MDDLCNETIKNVEEYLIDYSDNSDIKISYVLASQFHNEVLVFATDGVDELLQINSKNEVFKIPEWDFNFDEYLFEYLQKGYEIKSMDYDVHSAIWNCIKELYPEDIKYQDGVQRYLVYCKDNMINNETIEKNSELKTPDIMDKLEEAKEGTYFDYKGFCIYIDELNYDNQNERLVNIYKSKQDFIDGNIEETVSFKCKGLNIYAKQYIDKNYIEIKEVNKIKDYCTFALGYDLLNKELGNTECDISYDICKNLVEKFLYNDKFYDYSKSTYDNLKEWIEENKEEIRKEYNKICNKTKEGRSR